MPLNEALQARDVTDLVVSSERDLLIPIVLASGGVLTVAWTGFLVWESVNLAIYLLG